MPDFLVIKLNHEDGNGDGDDDERADYALVVGCAGQINTTNCHSRPTASQYTLLHPAVCTWQYLSKYSPASTLL